MTSLGLMSAASRRTVSAEELETWIESPIHQTYSPPPLPTVLSLESMLIDRFDVYCWCSFVLDKMHMLSDLLKVGLRILMASGRLELMVSSMWVIGVLCWRRALKVALVKLQLCL